MKKKIITISISCGYCSYYFGDYEKKDIPKNLICPKCGVACTPNTQPTVGYSRKRNYPEGFWN